MTAGYSGTPLAVKLGLKAGAAIKLVGAPTGYRAMFEDWPADVRAPRTGPYDFIHVFADRKAALAKALPTLKRAMKPDGALWISWPKKTARVETDVGENDLRMLALPLGLVDVKVCAVDATWSGLKFVIPVKDRGRP